MAYFTFGLFIAGFYATWRVVRSPFGKILQAIRDNEPRAISLGYRTNVFKLIAFVISGALSGLAGAMKALIFQVVPLSDIHWFMSGTVVLMVLLGGMGTFFGPVVGVVVLIAMEHYLEFLGSWLTLVMGVVYIVCVHLFRRGVVGELARILGTRPQVQGETP
jgi:branched-chain amino acid transport system permease protein